MSEPDADFEDLLIWLDGVPRCVRELARRFPPGCEVRATKPLVVPAPGSMGRVVSYGEAAEDSPEGWLGVVGVPCAAVTMLEPIDFSASMIKAQCMPDYLELVSEHPAATREMVERALTLRGWA